MWMLALLLTPLATAQDWSEESCPTTGSAQFKYVRGEATGKTEAEALSAALDAALARAKPDVCEGSVESPRCAARMAHVVQYGGDTDTQGGKVQACRSVAIDWDKLNPLNEVVDTWLKDLDTLAASAKATVGDNTTLYIEGPYGPGDCTLGGWSTHLERRVAAGLGLVSDAPKDSAGVLRLRITESGSEAVLAADVRRPDWDGDTFKALEPVTWPSALFVAGHEDICGNETQSSSGDGQSTAAEPEVPNPGGRPSGEPVNPSACSCDGGLLLPADETRKSMSKDAQAKMLEEARVFVSAGDWSDLGLPKKFGKPTGGPRCPVKEIVFTPLLVVGDNVHASNPACASGQSSYLKCEAACERPNVCILTSEDGANSYGLIHAAVVPHCTDPH